MYRIRNLREDDALTLAAMISRDPDHSAKGMTADFFFPKPWQPVMPRPLTPVINLCYEDDEGPVFYLQLEIERGDTIRLHVQFDSQPAMARRTIFMLKWAMRRLIDNQVSQTACRRIVFDSINESLREFCRKFFGFQPAPGSADMELILPEVPLTVPIKLT